MSTTGPAKSGCGLKLLAVLVGISLLVIAAIVWWNWAFRQAMHTMFVGETGPVTVCAEWPAPLKDLLDKPVEIVCDAPDIMVHCLCHGWDREYVWRMDNRPDLFATIEEEWELTEVHDPRYYMLEGFKSGLSRVPAPEWYSPHDDGETSFYVSPAVLGEGESHYFHVAFDNKRNVIFVHFWFDF